MRNIVVDVKDDPWSEVHAQCLANCREHRFKAVAAMLAYKRAAGKYATEQAYREAEVGALTELVAGLMVEVSRLSAREKLGGGWWARLVAWWRR